jgi:hypothetical protein
MIGAKSFPAVVVRDLSTVKNSGAFDRAAYEADGGDAWTDPRRASFFEQAPVGADKALWAKAKQKASEANLPQWQAVLWIYRKLGGKHA